MKKTVFLAGAFATMLLATACKKKGCTDSEALNYNQYAQQNDGSCEYPSLIENSLQGQISQDTTLTADKIWTIIGRVAVTNGTTLTIEPGTIIKAQAGTGANASCLLIARGAKIMAQGTAQAPIIFTTVADNIQIGQIHGTSIEHTINGLWGGVIICGNAPISADAQSVQIEGIPPSDQTGLYGGTDASDNSGVLSHVSIRHGGANIGEGNEINGLTLGGVGTGTIVDNIEIVANQDDGIELFGGTVNCQNLLIWNAGDDCLDIDQGYAGDITNVLIEPGLTTDHVFEFDGGEGIDNPAFTVDQAQIISADTAQAHFRAQATGFLNYHGIINIQEDPGTNVVTFEEPAPGNQSTWSWTWWSNK